MTGKQDISEAVVKQLADERAQVAELTAQGEAGLAELRALRVGAFVTQLAIGSQHSQAKHTAPMDDRAQAAYAAALMRLAEREEEVIGGRPNGIRLFAVESGLGVYEEQGGPFNETVRALRGAHSTKAAEQTVQRFIALLHRLSSSHLITPAADEYDRALGRDRDLARTVRAGAQRHFSDDNRP
jgi:hypothetical protein